MEEKRVDNTQEKSSSPLPTGAPINWALITGPVPEPVLHATSVPSLQTDVKSFKLRRTRGRNREKEVERSEKGVLVSSPIGRISSEVSLRQRPRGIGQVSLPPPSWQSRAAKNLSSSDEGEEVEVQVKLQIHSPPAETQGEQVFQGGEETDKELSERKEGQDSFMTDQSCGLREGSRLENLLSDNSNNSKDEPSTPSPPVLSKRSAAISNSTSSSSTPSMSTRHWAPPKGFWRVVRPETLPLNGVGPQKIPSTVPLKDYTQVQALEELQTKPESGAMNIVGQEVDDSNSAPVFKHNDSVEHFLDRCEQKEADAGDKGLCSSDSWESTSSQSDFLSADEKLKVKQRAYAKLRERQQHCREEREQSGEERSSCYSYTTVESKVASVHGILDGSDTAIVAQELEPYLRSLIISDDLSLSPRHEQAKLLLERARLKARSNHVKGDGPCRRVHSDHRSAVKKQQIKSPNPVMEQKAVQTNEDASAQTASGPLLVPTQRDTSPVDHGGRSRRYGCSPTRVRFEDESEKEAESRYLDRVRHRGRTGFPMSNSKESNADSSSSGSEWSRSQRSVSMPAPQRKEDATETTTVIKEIIVLVKKCEACGSVVREPQPVLSPVDPQNTEPQQPGNPEDPQGKSAPRCVPSNKPEGSTRPKASLTVTFAGAYVLGEDKESSTGWKSSGFGKLRRRSRKGESRLESGHGPYGPSWAQRRNSNPRNRINTCRAVSFDPGSPVTLEPCLLASGGARESPAQSLPIKSALKSSSRNRSAAGQSTVQFQTISNQGEEVGVQHPALLDSPDARRECLVSLTQGTPATSNPAPCIRPFTLRYSPARLNTDLPAAEHWDVTSDGTGLSGDSGSGPECRSALRGLSRAEDLRAELLRAEHLKAEALWEENSDGSRKLDGRPKLFLRRFFSSIGLNSVGRLVKGGRSNSMEQLSVPTAGRASSASPSPTRRPQPTIRIQRTPSLQALHTVLPLAQLRKASSVQSLERRTERLTILGEVQIPYGLAPSPDSPQLELDRALRVDDVLASRIVRPVGRVTQAFPDGTLLLELTRPPNGPFGFVISRGKGRPDTGVYIEKVVDGSDEGPYVGLLGVGDEILEVNGEAVAGLSLDQVTRLMTRESTASLRIMPARRSQR
ncbi:flocculation protein FLO11-like isoform X1 [Solea senegalensis]|uniref:Flocculation protein FLO11-like isoform X1 n=1 Tax=Solea senegalensis TaxID=28829 RepID=A0AAV6TBW6_SOLSE|nr:uncharacterized protein si:ch211-13f8.1 isoform X2 [Solea senegalensis]KAG7526980.1 flocculation protein FLO11-like isoform X1 [Solea senegalensis]